MATLAFVTSNEGKLREFGQMLGVELERVDLQLEELQSLDTAAVATDKARQAYSVLGRPVVVEDTGLYIDAWNGFPGALVKWLVKSVGLQGIIRMLGNETDRRAHAKTSICLRYGSGARLFEGTVHGSIADSVRGTSDFGWDPIFIPEGMSNTFAELGHEAKNAVSMRSKAVAALREFLDKNGVSD
ncbi:MAG: RdgB/HAM1 family non-canonical purine NTP pyrophosphatase [Candidatus Marsarchaeota archaeon]|jgi:XTP/dITP diphosphohydrolase|nr:RdgB/HAM1 family non-canonical purine NTP pyrophosphatase [Candidatus Marsarchaeota archaeon]